MAGKEKNRLERGIKAYFAPQLALSEEAEKLDQERQVEEENEKVLSTLKAEPDQSE